MRKKVYVILVVSLVTVSPILYSKQIKCSRVRTLFLHLKNSIKSQEDKNYLLYKAVVQNDYCATKFWLEHGIRLKDAFGEFYKENPDGTFLYVRIWCQFSRIKLIFSNYSGPQFSEDLLALLKQYGVDGIKLCGPK